VPRRRAHPRRPLVSWPLYRLLAVVALVPVLVAALAVSEPALPPPPAEPLAQFDGSAAATTAAFMLSLPRDRAPGGDGDLAAANYVRGQLAKVGYQIAVQNFAADLPDQPNVPLRNVIGYLPGRRHQLIAVFAHHDAVGNGVDDNASATGVMLELAKQLQPLTRERGIVLVSTDGGTSGGQGAAYFAAHSPLAPRIEAAVVLDSVSAVEGSPIRIVIRPDTARGTSPTLFRTARSVITRVTGRSPIVPGLLDQLSGLAIPYALNEQGPLLARGVPAITLTAGPPPDPSAAVTSLDPDQLGQVGDAAVNLVVQLDGASAIEPGGRPAIFVGSRTVRGWLAEVALVALLGPALACMLDMAARCRRRQITLSPAVAALAWRSLAWAAGLVTLWILPVLPGNLASGLAVAPQANLIGISWTGILLALLVGVVVWRFVGRPRIAPGPPFTVTAAERTGGLAAGLLGLGFASALLSATNPFALILVLPAAHLWLVLPTAARLGRRFMVVVYLLGMLGPVLLVFEYATRFHLGLSTPRAMLAMAASGYLSPVIAACLALAGASASQVAALIAGRYGPAHAPKRGYN
jgi:Peptidase family M28